MQFRKQPVVIDAVQWMNEPDGDSLKAILSLARNGRVTFAADGTADLVIETLEGDMRAKVGDWIIRGVKGELYPCKPDIFEATYEPVEAPSNPQETDAVKLAFLAGYAAHPADGRAGWDDLDGTPRQWSFDLAGSCAGDLAEDAYRAWVRKDPA